MAHMLLIAMLCLSPFSHHCCPQSAEAAPGAPRVTSGRRRAGCWVQQCRTARKGSLRCTNYYFKCSVDCKEREKVIYFSYLFMPGRLSVLSPDHPVRGSLLTLHIQPCTFPPRAGEAVLYILMLPSRPLPGLPTAAPAGSQPAGREPCRMQNLSSGNNYQLSKSGVQDSHYVASDLDFWTCLIVLQVLPECLECFWWCFFFF